MIQKLRELSFEILETEDQKEQEKLQAELHNLVHTVEIDFLLGRECDLAILHAARKALEVI